ncbi:MAG: UDP-N-acetylmuramate dehydrogenase [Candidatus Omnitrophica bacterium]|nr:UDP-N-acetylmuramate dehydrogenase [Candidatus Omnitrophota bacterium]
MESFRILKNSLKGKFRFGELLYKHTTFRIGGPAKIWVEPEDEKDLRGVLQFVKAHKLKIFVIGSGSNVLADDKGFDGVVIRLSSPYFKDINFEKSKVLAGTGTKLSHLVFSSCKHSLGGLENLAGIPGTVGGAVCMNAGYKKSIGEFVHKARVMDETGKLRTLYSKDLKFGYRNSNLSRYVILEVEIGLKKEEKENLIESYEHLIRLKKASQPWSRKSAGCVFKNPTSISRTAAGLIELCGLKGKRFGGAKISDKHANFIINVNRAASNDVIGLMDFVQKRVKKKFGIALEPELVRI